MKRMIVGCVVVGLLGCVLLWKFRPHSSPVTQVAASEVPTREKVEIPLPNQRTQAEKLSEDQLPEITATAEQEPASSQPPLQSSAGVPPAETNSYQTIVAQLVSPHLSFQDKQEVWKQLRGQHNLDEVISALRQDATNNPTVPEYRTALGQAYINQIYVSRMQGDADPRDVSILGLKADQSFDAALALDPSNWEAQFFKAYSMSYWPAELNKRQEVVQRFTDLIQQQERMTAQPQFAQSYLLLGEQYQKAGRADYARQVWQRGAALFPADDALKKKLASQP